MKRKQAERDAERELAERLWRRENGLRRVPTDEAMAVYRARAKAILARERKERSRG